MKRLIVATRNQGKIRELQQLLSGVVDELLCAADLAGFPETVEDGSTFAENALKKAREAAMFSGFPALADDSGLVVDALNGNPGVYSARFAGEGAGDDANNALLLRELSGVPAGKRQAAFICALAFVTPDGAERTFWGRVGGRILECPQGSDGFGYDPLFLVDGYERTMAELNINEKNAVSHRGQAFRQFRDFLDSI
ncbi:MAG TPA: XTP/dITP diphosphatase [Desulfuromonadales bacterium]|nr:XTP/dITP diphosphatase [Desulfuromonadales bacterium]